MKTKILFITAFLLVSFTAKPQIQWQKSLGGNFWDEANSIVQTSDGGYIVAGSSASNDGDVSGNHGNYDYWIVKLDDSGNIQWQRSLGGSDFDQANSIIHTSDGGYIVAGFSKSNDGDVSGNHGNEDYWIVKLNSTGNIQWQKSLGGNNDDEANSIVQTSDGGYIVAGASKSNDGNVSGNHGGSDYWIVKLDSAGNIQWQMSHGGSNDDEAYSIVQTSDGGYIVAGASKSNNNDVSGNHGDYDYWIVKLDASGNIQWQKSYGGDFEDKAYSIVQTLDGRYVVAGASMSLGGDVIENHGASDYWIVKLDSSGNIQWQKSLGGNAADEAHSIIQTSDGGYAVAGISSSNDGDVSGHNGNTTYSDYWIVKLDTSGNLQWENSFGGSEEDEAYSIVQTSDGGYIVAGSSQSNNGDVSGNHGTLDYWIVKLMYNISSKNACYGTNTGTATVEWFDNVEPSYLWSNGDTTATADSLGEGWYYVTINYNSYTIIDSVYVGEFDSLSIQLFSYDPSCYGLDNGSIDASVSGGTPPYSYLWNTGQTTFAINDLAPGTYSVTVTDTNGCFVVDSTTITYPEPLQDSIIFTEPSQCFDACNGSATIYVYGGNTPYSYQWSNGATDQTIQLCSNQNYTVTITDSSNCTIIDSVNYPVLNDSIEICIVTIDTATGKCLVVWERPDVQILNGFAVYKKTGTTTYSEVGNVNWEDMTQFLDTTSLPAAFAHSYKICMIDTCGNYAPLSYYHKTMYLTANQGANSNEIALHWTNYEDESGDFQPETYSIYRKCIPTNPSYELIATIPADLTDYNDINPPAGDLYYLVLTPHDNCIPTSIDKAQGGPYNYSISNIDDYEIQQYANTAEIFVPVSVYPNPVKTNFTVEIYNPQGYLFNIKLINANGKTVYETNTSSNKMEINRGDLPPGIYNITITGNNKVYNRKIIME